MAFFDKIISNAAAANSENEENTKSTNADHLERMVSNEENYFAFVLLKCMQLCPLAFGKFLVDLTDFYKQFLVIN